MLFGMALKNLGRNKRRTFLAVLGIALGAALATTMSSFQYGAWTKLVGGAIAGTAGHVVVQAEGFQEERDAALVVPDSGAVAQKLGALWPDGVVVRRAFIGGLISSPRGSAAVGVVGILPEVEAPFSRLDDSVREGAWLEAGDAEGVIIGDALARTLEVGVGDKVVLMVQIGDADVESRLLRVRGISHTGAEVLDAFTATVGLGAVQPLLPGPDAAHQVAVIVASLGIGVPDLAPARAVVGPGLALMTWREALPGLKEQMDLDTGFNDYLYGFLLLVVAVGVLNTILMGMMERVRELGVMLALGMQPRKLALLLLLEGLWIGLIGAIGSVVLSALAYKPLYIDGIDFGEMMAEALPMAVAFDPVLRASFDPVRSWLWPLIGVAMAVLASLYPAWQATRVQPVDAMRHV
jgi:ABC-type lipoprotein release transport system permease subunit